MAAFSSIVDARLCMAVLPFAKARHASGQDSDKSFGKSTFMAETGMRANDR
jgi:hypothetical protein